MSDGDAEIRQWRQRQERETSLYARSIVGVGRVALGFVVPPVAEPSQSPARHGGFDV